MFCNGFILVSCIAFLIGDVNLKHRHNQTAGELDALLPSILDKAFKGEL